MPYKNIIMYTMTRNDNAQQEKLIYEYKNAKKKLYKTYVALWYNKQYQAPPPTW